MLSKAVRKLYNFILIPLTFKNWIQVMRDVLLSYLPFADTVKTRIVVLKKGQKLRVRLHNIYDIGSILEVYQRNVYSPMFIHIPDNPVILDIGASIGDFSVFCGSTFKNARVFSFEPTPEAYKVLKENIELNHLEDKIKPNLLGVSGVNNQISIAGETYSSISLMDIFRENRIQKCDLLKMDCEGREYEIFLNASSEVLSLINAIVMECHIMDNGENLSKLNNHLTQAKFKVTTTKITAHNVCYLYAARE